MNDREAIRAIVRDMLIVHAVPHGYLRLSLGLDDELSRFTAAAADAILSRSTYGPNIESERGQS